MKYKTQQELVTGLRDLADFIEANIGLPIDTPAIKFTNWVYDRMDRTTWTPIEGSARQKMRRAALLMGQAQKHWGETYIDLRKNFGPITLEFTIQKEKVCNRVVTGMKVVPRQVIEARVVEVVEWECDEPSLLAAE